MEKLTGLKKIKTAIFISGTGSNLKYILKFSKIKNFPISIDLIFSNTSKAKGLRFSNQFNIKKYVSSFKNYKTAEAKILNLLNKENIKFICLAGFMKILSKNFIKFFKLLPVPDIKTAVLIFLRPVNFTTKFNFLFSCSDFSNNIGSKMFCKKFSNFI